MRAILPFLEQIYTDLRCGLLHNLVTVNPWRPSRRTFLMVTEPRHKTVVFANRYDGIDLPDDACRVLILDSLPRPESLLDRYDEMCRQDSEAIAVKIARVIEQGLGRSVRGARDYSVIILTGGDLVKHLRGRKSRRYFSDQTRTQIEIGHDAAALAKHEVEQKKKQPLDALMEVASLCLKRDEGWKEFYAQEMEKMARTNAAPKMLKVFAKEYRAEQLAESGMIDEAVKVVQGIIDEFVKTPADRWWYLQEMGALPVPRQQIGLERSSGTRAQAQSLSAEASRRADRFDDRSCAQKRMARIIEWVRQRGSYDDLSAAVQGMVDNLRFGVEADTFERALDDLGIAMGFETQRPDAQWGAGPDNLWAIVRLSESCPG
jgi:replicative superfamily II helicase